MITELNRLKQWMHNHNHDGLSLSLALGYEANWLVSVMTGRRKVGFGVKSRFMITFGPSEFDVVFGLDSLYRGAYTNRFAVQTMAQMAVANAIRLGQKQPAKAYKCCGCDNPATEFHHQSYLPSDWLNVIPVCRKCHRAADHGRLNVPLGVVPTRYGMVRIAIASPQP